MNTLIASLLLSLSVSQDGGRWIVHLETLDEPISVVSSGYVSNSSIPGFSRPVLAFGYWPNTEDYRANERLTLERGFLGAVVTISHRYGGSFRFEPLMGKRTLWVQYKTRREILAIDTDVNSNFVPVDPIQEPDVTITDWSKQSASKRCVMVDTEDTSHWRIREIDVRPGGRYILRFRYLATENALASYETMRYYDNDVGWKLLGRDEFPLRSKTKWTMYEKLFVMPKDTNNFSFTFRVRGDGQMWIDDVSLEPMRNQKP